MLSQLENKENNAQNERESKRKELTQKNKEALVAATTEGVSFNLIITI